MLQQQKTPGSAQKGKSRECVFSSFCVRRFAVRKKATVKALFQQVCSFLLLAGAQCLHQPGRFDQLPADILHDLHRDAVPVIRGQQRIRDAVQARQIAMYLIRSMTNLSLDDIGKQFDNRDHSTVLYSIQQVEKKMKKDAAFAETVKEIKTNINSKR